MSSRPLLIAGIVVGVVVGVAVFATGLSVVAMSGPSLGGSAMALVMLATALGLVLDTTWLAVAVDRLGKLDRGEGQDGEGPDPDPTGPLPPSGGQDWWPEFERELSAYLETAGSRADRRRARAASHPPGQPGSR